MLIDLRHGYRAASTWRKLSFESSLFGTFLLAQTMRSDDPFDGQGKRPAHKQRLEIVEAAEPDQPTGIAVAGVEHREIAPRREVAKVAWRLVAEWSTLVLRQLTGEISDLLVAGISFDGQF